MVSKTSLVIVSPIVYQQELRLLAGAALAREHCGKMKNIDGEEPELLLVHNWRYTY